MNVWSPNLTNGYWGPKLGNQLRTHGFDIYYLYIYIYIYIFFFLVGKMFRNVNILKIVWFRGFYAFADLGDPWFFEISPIPTLDFFRRIFWGIPKLSGLIMSEDIPRIFGGMIFHRFHLGVAPSQDSSSKWRFIWNPKPKKSYFFLVVTGILGPRGGGVENTQDFTHSLWRRIPGSAYAKKQGFVEHVRSAAWLQNWMEKSPCRENGWKITMMSPLKRRNDIIYL